jgi:c(7)-type cytochrome triheme protein
MLEHQMSRARQQARSPDAGGQQLRSSQGKRRVLSLFVLLLGGVAFFTNIIANARWPNIFIGPGMVTQERDRDYSSFSHGSQRHASLDCAACHHRVDNAARPAWPGHKDCTGCHLDQFVTPSIPMCVICHTDVNGREAPLKNFPENFKESFNARFDHAQHMREGARPGEGCAFCHDRPLRRGVALNIPSGLLNAHGKCYTCHTPGSQTFNGREMASCGACHERARYAPTGTNARAFRASFSHAAHGPRQRLGCTDCHNLLAGLPQSRQVTSPATAEHFNNGRAMSCMSCHNGKRAFGGDLNFKDCRRCHTGPTFRMGG